MFKSGADRLNMLITGMKSAYARGENAMAYARSVTGQNHNEPAATLISYDMQAGSYVAGARAKPEATALWCNQIASIIAPLLLQKRATILEVGCGEATTLAGVISQLGYRTKAYGFDLSWSRMAEGLRWLREKNLSAHLFVADLFNIPLKSNSIDIVYSSHSLEPNGGR